VDLWVLACLKNQDKTILIINWLAAWLTAAVSRERKKRSFIFKKKLKRSDQVQIIFKKMILDQDRAKFDLRS
jgi:hypothetical protein